MLAKLTNATSSGRLRLRGADKYTLTRVRFQRGIVLGCAWEQGGSAACLRDRAPYGICG